MSKPQYHYRSGQELDEVLINWPQRDNDGSTSAKPLSTSYSAHSVVVQHPTTGATILTKTSGLTVADTYPNLIITWSAADMSTIRTAIGTVSTWGDACPLLITARRTADSLDATFSPKDLPTIEILP